MSTVSVRRLLISFVFLALSVSVRAQQPLWVGETYRCDATSSIMGLTSDVYWSCNGGYIQMTGSGFYRDVRITQFFSGTATVKMEWNYRLLPNDRPQPRSRTWTFTCRENPISIYPTTMTLAPGQEAYLTYSLAYSNQYASYADAYFSAGSSVVSVSRNGHVVANKEGTAYVNVYSKVSDASQAPYCLITVKNIQPTSVSVNDAISIREGESFKLTPKAYPEGATTGYTWTTDNPEVATVSSDGVVTAVKKGVTKVKVTTTVGGHMDECKVTVKEPPVPPTSMFVKGMINLYKGFSTVLVPVLEPSVAETQYTWSTSDASVASVSSTGKITANSVGTAVITVKSANGLTASAKVTVSEVPDYIDIPKLKARMSVLESMISYTLNIIL